ncbi:uncharacterized protein A1O9_12695 [Exophiala aquamarina CBS 119918]|uniref:Major facilitator superfamily (MFS) profile domain-containing protein n=1 Tax=Exophiala aquamarina CBS 119918 TaxID=1182545 RepID=A0A072P6Y8_9EURO|nr:uncharacterized protein A1O9_12695 [Exophiala aquamarina CBS 119918]KEF51345.1 hypothetical protein A1O9_12695 [Exophiala aquamarina CBS 119918]
MVHVTPTSIPGTIHLVNTDSRNAAHTEIIILNPTPSADPEDPLNWSKARKLWSITMVYVYVFGVGIATTVQYSILTNISEETGIALADLNTGTGLMFLFAGWGCLIWQPIALTYGRRGVYIISSFLCIGPMVWTAYTTSKGIWWAHRILIGLVVAPVESLPEVSVPDLFFAHERGNYIGFYTFILFGSNALAPLLAGFITKHLEWKAAIWFGTIVVSVTTVIIFFGMEETIYFRSAIEGIDHETPEGVLKIGNKANEASDTAQLAGAKEDIVTVDSGTFTEPRTYRRRLQLFRLLPNRPTVKQLGVMMYRPLQIFFFFPNIVWAGFLYGASLCLYQIGNATVGFVLGGPGYGWASDMVGLSYLAGVLGSLVGWAYAGWGGDRLTIWLAKCKKGIREPEQRLWILVPSGFIAAGGLILWGVGAAHQVHFIGLMFALLFLNFGMVVGATTALAYNVDCFKDIAGETLILVMIIRNTMGYGMAYGITPWLQASGLQNTLIGSAFLYLACTFTFLIMTVWGRSLRKMCANRYWRFVETLVVPS